MNYLDLFFVIVFLIGAVKGYMKGLIVELFSIVAFFIGLFVAIELTVPVSVRFFETSDYFQMLTVGVFLALFVGVIVMVNLIGKIIKKVIDFTFFGLFDNVLGALASILKWSLIISIVFWVLDSIGFHLPKEQTDHSVIYPFVENMGPNVYLWLSEIFPFVQDSIDSLQSIGNNHRKIYTFLIIY